MSTIPSLFQTVTPRVHYEDGCLPFPPSEGWKQATPWAGTSEATPSRTSPGHSFLNIMGSGLRACEVLEFPGRADFRSLKEFPF